jgi:DivIVA domain-containing protein
MIDLTPLDVRKKRGDFRRVLRGYDPEEVDTFMDLVAERFEELVRENLALTDKTVRIESQLEALVGRESAVQEALVTAQKIREDVRDQTRRDAELLQAQASREVGLLKAEAEAEVARQLGEAEALIVERKRALEDLERSRLKFLKSFKGLLERELDAVEVEEARRPLEEIPLELKFRGWGPKVEEATSEEAGPDGFKTQVWEGGAVAGSRVSSEDPALSEDMGSDTEESEAAEPEEERSVEERSEEEAPVAEEPSPVGQEPKWLFSLLKKEEDLTARDG